MEWPRWLVQKLATKSGSIDTVEDVCQQFNDRNDRILMLTANFDEIILVFDSYKADLSKQKTREK